MELVPLKRFVDCARPITYGIVQAGDYIADGIPYIRPADMDAHEGVRDVRQLQRTSKAIAAQYRRSAVQHGDIVVSIGPSYGKTMVVPVQLDGANLTQGTARIAPAAEIDTGFLRWALRAGQAQTHWEAAVGGATFRALNLEPLSQTPIPVWPLWQQRAIADFLDAETARIDALIAGRLCMNSLTQERQLAAVRSGVGGLLTSKSDVRPSSLPWLDVIPGQWQEVQLKLIARLGSGHTPSRSHPEWWLPDECVIPWVTTGEVAALRADDVEYIQDTRERISEVGISNSSAQIHPRGTVVLSRTASVGFSGMLAEPMATSQDFATWTCGSRLRPRYLLLCLRAMRPDLLGRLAIGSTHKTIYMPDIESIRVPLPTINEQDRVVDAVWSRLAGFKQLRGTVEQQVRLLRERRQALITAAVTREIDVSTASGRGILA